MAETEVPDLGVDRYRDQPPDPWQVGAATLLLGLGFAPLVVRLEPQIGAFLAGLFALRLAALRWPGLRLGRWPLVALMLLGLVNVVDAYRGVAGQAPGTALLLTMVGMKLLEVNTRRDLRVLTLVFGFVLVIAFLFSKSPALTAFLALLLVADVALIADLNCALAPRRLRPRLRTALVLTVQALPLALLLFVLFPRLDAPLWDLGLEDEQARSGLKDWLEPGSVGELVVSGEDAFRVHFDRPLAVAAEGLYWRGPVLWQATGRRWLPAPAQGWPDPEAPVVEPIGEPVDYLVVMEPTDQHWLMALDLPVGIPDAARLTPDFQVLADRPVDDLRMYRMSSVLAYRTADLSLDEEAAGLQLPANITPRMRALVGEWSADGAAPRQVVERALAHINQQPFRYTLLPDPVGANPADEFLFETQSGFCEHYASSFVLLMRIAGIPARVVLGYLGGEYNPISRDYLVRQSDAHAWAEVWLDGDGWVRVDPTAAVAPERVEQDARLAGLGQGAPVRFRLDEQQGLGRLVHGLRLLSGALDSGWKKWVVGYSSLRQRSLLDGLGLGPLREYGLVLLMLIGSALLLLALSLTLARPGQPRDPVLRCYQRFCARLARSGLPRAPQEGPLDYRDRVLAARPDLADRVLPITAAYLALRYRNDPDVRLADLQRQVRGFRPGRGPGPGLD